MRRWFTAAAMAALCGFAAPSVGDENSDRIDAAMARTPLDSNAAEGIVLGPSPPLDEPFENRRRPTSRRLTVRGARWPKAPALGPKRTPKSKKAGSAAPPTR
jgi:hypothetical protein